MVAYYHYCHCHG